MPNSPWVNSLLEMPPDGGLPSLKAFRAEVKGSRENITPLDSLLKG
jgi:formylmethanofuran dehydrogenase subunit D